jgi:cytochrome c553
MYRLNASLSLALFVALLNICSVAAGRGQADPIDDKVAICASCHGLDGIPTIPKAPVIWGQHEGYLYIQLRDFKSGARKNENMTPIVANFTRDDLMAIAAYFSKKPWPQLGQPQAPKDAAKKALTANASVGCTSCHLDAFQGDGTIPRLAGQDRAYLEKTIADFRSRARANNPGMSDLMNAASADDLAALAQYLAGL